MMALSENKQRMAKGELYYAFTPELIAERARCTKAVRRYNAADDVSRRELVSLWREVVRDDRPLPPKLDDDEADTKQFKDDPWIESPTYLDYGTQLKLGDNVYINAYSTFLDTCTISIGSRTLFGPNVSVYSGTHPLDPEVRNGLEGPETGKEVHIGEDCWIAGNVIILPGVTIGRGSTVGAGSVVTKNVPPFHLVAGNPARIIRKIQTNMDLEQRITPAEVDVQGAEQHMADAAI